ncbi:MAG: carbon storage regulator CsrA [Nitrospira sp.]|nr:carbon storage regulator CsrA [Nitrospira sp.]
MLVLSRRRGEGVTIGPDVRIVVLGIKAVQVSLGIEAPPQVAVHRDEVQARVQEQNRLDASASAIPLAAIQRLSKNRDSKTTAGGGTGSCA